MSYYKNCVLIVLEVNEPNKAPDIRYITVGSSDTSKSDAEFGASAIAYFKEGKDFASATTFNLKGIQKFDSTETYLKFFQNQLSDYLDSFK